MQKPIIILTDFGTSDPFVGIMKGVIAEIAASVPIIDLTQEIPPGDIQRGAVVLWQSVSYFPKGSTFLTVVDPGVGTNRSPIILQTKGYTFVGPDNGIFTYILGSEYQAWKLQNPLLALPSPRMTFHGRDIFAPAAAHAALGIPGAEFGDNIPDLELIPNPRLSTSTQGLIDGEILHADHFGNLLTSLGTFTKFESNKYSFAPWVGDLQNNIFNFDGAGIQLPNKIEIPIVSTFAEIPNGACAGVIGSSGLVEIAANRQSAANLLNLRGGESITLKFQPTI